MSQYLESYNPASYVTNKFSFGNIASGTGLARNSTGTYSFPTAGANLALSFDSQSLQNTMNDLNNTLANTPPKGMTLGEGLGYGIDGLKALTGLANAYIGYKNYKLAKEQFGFEKAAVNRNIANQAKQINNAYNSSASIAAAMQGTDANGVLRPEIRERYMNEAKNRHVDGSKIG